MELRALRVVVAVADQGSVTRAAAVLHQSPSSVSHTLVGLEAEIDAHLFHRLPRGMALTDAGEVFVVAARRTLHEAQIALAAVDDVRGLVTGQLTIVATRTFTVALADLIGEFASQHPGVLVRVLAPETDKGVAEKVRSGACEVGVGRAGRVPSDLDSCPIGVEATVVILPVGHPLAARDRIEVADLGDERLVAPLVTSAMRPDFDNLFRREGLEPLIVAEAATTEMALELVRAGVGSAITTSSSVAPVTDRGAVAIPLAGRRESRIVLLTRRGHALTPAARAFRDLGGLRARG